MNYVVVVGPSSKSNKLVSGGYYYGVDAFKKEKPVVETLPSD